MVRSKMDRDPEVTDGGGGELVGGGLGRVLRQDSRESCLLMIQLCLHRDQLHCGPVLPLYSLLPSNIFPNNFSKFEQV